MKIRSQTMLLSITENYCDGFSQQLYIVYVDDKVNCICTFDNIDRVLMHIIYYAEPFTTYSQWRTQADVVNSFNNWNANDDNLSCDWKHNNVRVFKPKMRQRS